MTPDQAVSGPTAPQTPARPAPTMSSRSIISPTAEFEGKACQGTACFAARHLNPARWAEAIRERPPRFTVSASVSPRRPRARRCRGRPVKICSREGIVLGRLAAGRGPHPGRLPGAGWLRRAGQGADAAARGRAGRGRKIQSPRPRRRGFPDRSQMAGRRLAAAGREICRRQRRRRRRGRLH